MYANSAEAKKELLELLQEYAQDPGMRFSNWISSIDENSISLELISEFLENWKYSRQGGVKNTQTKEGYEYSGMPDIAWQMTQVLTYMESYKNGFAKMAMPIPADSGNIHFINSPVFRGVQNGKVPRYIKNEHGKVVENPLFIAVKNTVSQEIERMKAARDLLFIVDEKKLTFKPKEHKFRGDPEFDEDIHLDYTTLEKNYYWTELEYSKEAGILLPKLINKKGEPTGNVFKFQNITSINEVNDLRKNGLFLADKLGKIVRNQIKESIGEKVSEFIEQQIEIGKEDYKDTEQVYNESSNKSNYATFSTMFS